MFEFFQWLSSTCTTLFVLSSMFNVGLTQHPMKIVNHLSNWRYLLRMIVANLIIVPALMSFFILLFGLEGPYAVALTIFACSAGAPLLIKLTVESDNDVAAGATIQMVLMVATVFMLPTLLSLLVEGVSVSMWDIAQPLLFNMILPLLIGMALHVWANNFAGVIQPWVAKLSNIALYTMLISTIIGYLRELADWELWKTIFVGIIVLLLAFYIGYGTGMGHPQRSQLGALGTAQRNTAAAMITAGSFDDPLVFVIIALLNTLMMFVLLRLATRLGDDARIAFLDPIASDMPGDAQRPHSDD